MQEINSLGNLIVSSMIHYMRPHFYLEDCWYDGNVEPTGPLNSKMQFTFLSPSNPDQAEP